MVTAFPIFKTDLAYNTINTNTEFKRENIQNNMNLKLTYKDDIYNSK